VIQYGPTAPFTLGIVETLVSEPLPPMDWKAIAKACLSEAITCYGDLSFKIDALVKPIGIRAPRSPLLPINWQGKANGKVCSNS
jgi:hypothetical protein